MRLLALVLMILAYAFAIDLESVQRSSQRHYGPSVEKRKTQNPSLYLNMIQTPREESHPRYRVPEAQQDYQTMQDILAKMIAQENQEASWLENLRQASSKVRQSPEIKPPYDQDDFPSYAQGRQDDSFAWSSPPISIQDRILIPLDKRQSALPYRSHKQLPYSLRVPHGEVMKKRSVESKTESKTKSYVDNRKERSAVAAPVPKVGNATDVKMSPEQFKQFLTDEYYRNMAMSFATMRKRRSIADNRQATPTLRRNDQIPIDKLRSMEQALLQDAVMLLQNGGSDRSKVKNQVTERLDVAHDIENLKKVIQSLYSDSQRLNALDEAAIMAAGLKKMKEIPPNQQTSDIGGQDDCSELQMLSSNCAALRGMFPPPPVQGQFLNACNMHEICYACGAQHSLTAEQCDQAFLEDMRFVCSQLGSCNKHLVALLLEPLHKKRVFFKRNALPVCNKPCVANLFSRN